MVKGRWIRACFCLLLACHAVTADALREYQVKAAYLLNFAKFVDWPPASFAAHDSPVAICIFGKDPFGRDLDDLVQGETVLGRHVTVRRITQAPAPQTCQIFFTLQPAKELPEVLSSLGPRVLTVGEGEDFARASGMISFLVENRHVRFDIDQKAAEAAGLKLSSRLLAVARNVQK